MSVLDFGLGLAGLPEKTIQDLDKNLPALERIAAAAKQAEPLLTPLFPLLAKVWPDIVAVTPLIQELIAFAKQKETE
jgi:hypothetical protein